MTYLYIFIQTTFLINVLYDHKDSPWMTNGIIIAIKMKNNAHKEYIRSEMRYDYYVRFKNLKIELSNLIPDTKTEYHSKLATKLVNPSTSAKVYWSIFRIFANGSKVPVIPQLLINSGIVSNFKTKANYFNRFFNQQCTAISTDSSIPSSINLATNETVTINDVKEQLISTLIVALNPKKVHDHDGPSIRMLQRGSDSISKILSLIFWNCLKTSYYPAI